MSKLEVERVIEPVGFDTGTLLPVEVPEVIPVDWYRFPKRLSAPLIEQSGATVLRVKLLRD